jgi:hypothetical protein
VPADATAVGQWSPAGPQSNPPTGGYPAYAAAQPPPVYQDQPGYYGSSRQDTANGAAVGANGYQAASTGSQPAAPAAPGAGDGYAYQEAGYPPNGYPPHGNGANGYASNGNASSGHGHPTGGDAANGYASPSYGNNGQGNATTPNGANGYASNGNGGEAGTGDFPAPSYPSSGPFPVNRPESNGFHPNGQQPNGYQPSEYSANGHQAEGYASAGAPGTGAFPVNGQIASNGQSASNGYSASNGHGPNNGQGASTASIGEYRPTPGGPQSVGAPTFTPTFSPNGATGFPNGPATPSRNGTASQVAAANGNGRGQWSGQRTQSPAGAYPESPAYPQAPPGSQGEPYQQAPGYSNGAGHAGTGYPPANGQDYPPAPQPDWRDGYQAAQRPVPGYPGDPGQGYYQDQSAPAANGVGHAAGGYGTGQQTGSLAAADHPSSPGYAPPDRFDPSQQGYWQ